MIAILISIRKISDHFCPSELFLIGSIFSFLTQTFHRTLRKRTFHRKQILSKNFHVQHDLLRNEGIRCILWRELTIRKRYHGWHKTTYDGEAPLLKIWRMLSPPLLPLYPGPFRHGMVVHYPNPNPSSISGSNRSDRVPYIGQLISLKVIHIR